MTKKHFIIILAVFLSTHLFAGKIEKGFQALDIYNYFSAKQLFEKGLKKDSVGASFGLSIIYLRNDNPFYNLDSARLYVAYAAENYAYLKEKKKVKYAKIKIDSLSIIAHRNKVSEALYQRVRETHTIKAYNLFLEQNFWSSRADSVVYLRDYLAYDLTKQKGEAKAFKEYLRTYPNSELKVDAQAAYDRLNYRERTKDNNFIDYVTFIKEFPNSPYYTDAEDQIYAIYTKTGSFEAYKKFIANYPDNRNVPVAWKKMFNTYLQKDYSTSSMQSFLDQFKDYPFKDELEMQLRSADRTLYPIKERNKWGYIDETNTHYIKPTYEIAEKFHEGLAIVQLEGKYGFVDKTGDIVIDVIFDDAYQMSEGHAVVEMDGKWGLINRSGEFVIQPEYDDLGNLNEGFCYFSNGDLYGYFDEKGIVRLKEQYTAADDFEFGKAIVSNQGKYGLIDFFGTTAIPFKYERLKSYLPNIYLAKFNGLWGIINVRNDSLVAFVYDFIGEMSNNRAIVEKEGLFNYMDIEGNLLLAEWLDIYPEYRQFAAFNNFYAKIEFENGYNLIDTTGTKLFKKDKDALGNFGDYIAVKKNDKWGYINREGISLIGYTFTRASSFEGSYGKAGGAPLVGVIDKKGTYLVDPYFENIEFLNDSLLIAKSRGNYGMLTINGDTLMGFHYVSIEPFDENVVQLETREAVFYYHLGLKKFIRKEEE